jgi:hypothetical protein
LMDALGDTNYKMFVDSSELTSQGGEEMGSAHCSISPRGHSLVRVIPSL